MTKEDIKNIINWCFECNLDDNNNFMWWGDPATEIAFRFFNYEDYFDHFGTYDSYAWGVLVWDTFTDEEYLFPIYDYFDGTPNDLLNNKDQVIDRLADDILNKVDEIVAKF